jgi:hypothetical protein
MHLMKHTKPLFGALALALMFPAIASATLGESDASIETDQAQMNSGLKVVNRANFRVHEMQLPSGTVVKQYSSPAGLVFAVSWTGPSMPDLRQTLGRHFDTYVAAAKANHANHRQLHFQSGDLIVHAGGRMRSFSGLAYLASAMPAGVTVQDLK